MAQERDIGENEWACASGIHLECNGINVRHQYVGWYNLVQCPEGLTSQVVARDPIAVNIDPPFRNPCCIIGIDLIQQERAGTRVETSRQIEFDLLGGRA